MPRNGHFAHWIAALAALDPEAGRPAAVVACDDIRARADQVGDIEALLDVADQRLRAHIPCFEIQIGRSRRWRRRNAARRMPGGLQAELARGGAVEQPRL